MKRLLFAVLAVAALWSGYWYFAAQAQRDAIETWFAQLNAQGHEARYQDLSLKGYPNRVDAFFKEVTMQFGATQWRAPDFEMLALSYQPNHKIFVWPKEQFFINDGRQWKVSSEDMRASLITENSAQLERFNFTASELLWQNGAERLAMESLQIALHKIEGDAPLYRVALNIAGIADPTSSISPPDRVRFDAFVTLETPLFIVNRLPVETIKRIEIIAAEIGDTTLALQAKGEIDIDAEGYPEGAMKLHLQNWPGLAARLQKEDDILPEAAQIFEAFIALLAQGSRDLDLELRFEDRSTRLGGIPMGPAPRLIKK